ncbi:hypothetical protein Stok01_02743 [Sulfurisphaera tokodaii]
MNGTGFAQFWLMLLVSEKRDSHTDLNKLLEIIHHNFRKHLQEIDLAKCYKRIKNFITSSLKYKNKLCSLIVVNT